MLIKTKRKERSYFILQAAISAVREWTLFLSKMSEHAELDSLLQNILKSSEIEGESLNAESVRSSLAKRLMIKILPKKTTARTEGVADLQMDVFLETSRKLLRLAKLPQLDI